VPIGVETPDMIELRKRRIEDAMDQGGDTPALPYTILPEKKSGIGGAMMGSTHVYDVTSAVSRVCI
jgi:splicing factor 3B subunit 2